MIDRRRFMNGRAVSLLTVPRVAEVGAQETKRQPSAGMPLLGVLPRRPKAAKARGLTMPPSLRLRADQVIE